MAALLSDIPRKPVSYLLLPNNSNALYRHSRVARVRIAPRDQLLKRSAWLLHVINKRAPLLHTIGVRLQVAILAPELAGTIGV